MHFATNCVFSFASLGQCHPSGSLKHRAGSLDWRTGRQTCWGSSHFTSLWQPFSGTFMGACSFSQVTCTAVHHFDTDFELFVGVGRLSWFAFVEWTECLDSAAGSSESSRYLAGTVGIPGKFECLGPFLSIVTWRCFEMSWCPNSKTSVGTVRSHRGPSVQAHSTSEASNLKRCYECRRMKDLDPGWWTYSWFSFHLFGDLHEKDAWELGVFLWLAPRTSGETSWVNGPLSGHHGRQQLG